MLDKRVVAGAAALILTIGTAGSALAVIPGALDQSHDCATADCNVSNGESYPAWNSGNGTGNNDATAQVTLGQTFTAGKTGPLTAVSLYLGGVDGAPVPATFAVEVTNTDGTGQPNLGSVLTSGTVTTSGTTLSSSMTPDWVTVAFGTPPTVTAGHKYAIVLAVATLSASSAWMRWAVDSSSAAAYSDYAGGEAMAATRPTSSSAWSWQTVVSILTDGGSGTADYGFRTYVGAQAATPTAFVPTQPPTDTVSAAQGSGGTGALALFAVLGVIGAAGLLIPSLRGMRRGA